MNLDGKKKKPGLGVFCAQQQVPVVAVALRHHRRRRAAVRLPAELAFLALCKQQEKPFQKRMMRELRWSTRTARGSLLF